MVTKNPPVIADTVVVDVVTFKMAGTSTIKHPYRFPIDYKHPFKYKFQVPKINDRKAQ